MTEAATECGAKSAHPGRQPRYELQGADAVFASLADVTVSNLKNLFADETSDAAEPQREVEIFPSSGSAQRAAVADYRDDASQTQRDDAQRERAAFVQKPAQTQRRVTRRRVTLSSAPLSFAYESYPCNYCFVLDLDGLER